VRNWAGAWFVAIGFLMTLTDAVLAAPPASCASKFIGTWTYSGGTTVIAAGGVAYPKCPMCVPTQSWTCQGNTYLFSNSGAPGQFSATLSADGRQLIGSGTIATRVGGAAQSRENMADKKSPKAPTKKGADAGKVATSPPQSPLGTTVQRSRSCSDITGTGSAAPAATHCKDADRALYAARQVYSKNPQTAETEYKKAAAAARRAGDSALELSILREAIEYIAAAKAASTPSSPAATAAAAPAVLTSPTPVPGIWDGTRDKCDTAKELERKTASWYVMCVQPVVPKNQDSGYLPNPDPFELQQQARHACGSYSRETQSCFSEFKLKVILEQNPSIRDYCEKRVVQDSALRERLRNQLGLGTSHNRHSFLECVDDAYLYGSDISRAASRESLREKLRKSMYSIADQRKYPDHAGAKSIQCSGSGNCCMPGFGMKPTPGAFGAWSCQPLGLLAMNTTQRRLDVKAEAAYIEDFEERLSAAVINAAAAAVEALGSAMSGSHRETCSAASLAALHSAVKGGVPEVAEHCRKMADAARSRFALYANGSVDTSSDAMEDLLTNFRVNLGEALPR